jgi:GNAT superfamily N-acetyltransferase
VTLEVRRVPIETTRRLRQEVLRPHETLEEIANGEAAGTVAVGAFAGDQLVAVGMITPGDAPEGWRVRGMATAPAMRGRGAGSAVLGALLALADAGGAARVWCNARTPALSLYERAGFAAVGEEFELPMIGPHYVMERSSPSAA